MKKIFIFIGPIVICLLVGYFSSLVQSEAIRDWYPFLDKPALTPPNFVFPLAWGTLYILMGLSLGLILQATHRLKRRLAILFTIQLFLNFLWCLCFFAMRSPITGLTISIFLLSILLWYSSIARQVNLWGALLFIPYIFWVIFATYLNAYIWMHN